MAQGTVRIRGLKELNRDFGKLSKDLQKELRAELKEAAAPVAEEARSLAGRFGGNVAGGIAPGVRGGGAVVRQRNRKTTGQRPDFGALQMRTVLEPALVAKEDEVVRRVEQMLDHLGGHYGF